MYKLKSNYELDDYIFDNFNISEYQAKPIEELQVLIKKGDLHAYHGLVFKYNTGDGVLYTNKPEGLLKEGYDKGSLSCGASWVFSEYLNIEDVNVDKAIKEIQKLLDKKCGEALALYASMLYFGIGTEVDVDGAKKIFEYCISKDSWFGIQRYMGILSDTNKLRIKYGKNYAYDTKEEHKILFELAQKFGSRDDLGFQVKLYLYDCYLRGIGTQKDIKKAIDVINKVLYKLPNSSFMNYMLHRCHREESNYTEEAYNVARKALAYESDLKRKEDLYNHLAFMCIFGYGVEKDHLMAKYYVDEAIKAGGEDSYAYDMLGKMYELGIFYEKDMEKAKSIYEKSAKNKYTNALLWLARIDCDEGNYKRAEESYVEVISNDKNRDNIIAIAKNGLKEIIKKKCHNCKYVYKPVEKKGLLGKKKICPHCGAKWKSLYDYKFSKVDNNDELCKQYLELIRGE